MNRLCSALAVGLALAMPALAQARGPQGPDLNPSIAFADHGGVTDYRTLGDRTVYFEDISRHWYKATLMMPAFSLGFHEAIGIDAGPSGNLDSFGAVIVGHERYPFASFERVAAPPKEAR